MTRGGQAPRRARALRTAAAVAMGVAAAAAALAVAERPRPASGSGARRDGQRLFLRMAAAQTPALADDEAREDGIAARPGAPPLADGADAVEPESSIAGRVLDAATRQPVPDVSIEAAFEVGPDGGAVAALSDADGAFLLDGLLPGTFRLEASAAGLREVAPVTVEVGPLETAEVVILVAAAHQVAGWLRAGDRPCPRGHVELHDLTHHLAPVAAGRFHFDAIPPGRY